MALLSDGGVSSPDIWIVVLMLLVALIGAVLNPLVFRHNLKKKTSIPRNLYLALSSTDFLSCIILSTTFSFTILQPKEDSCWLEHNDTFCQEEYFKYIRKATLTEKAVGSVKWYLISTQFLITSVLAIARWYQIRFPLQPINKQAIEGTIASLFLFYAVFYPVKIFNDSPEAQTKMVIELQNVYIFGLRKAKFSSVLQYTIVLLLLLSSNVASIWSICTILRSPQLSGSASQRSRRLRSTLKIAALNASSVLMIGYFVFMLVDGPGDYRLLDTAALCFLPILLSVYNPIMYSILTDGLLSNKVQGRS